MSGTIAHTIALVAHGNAYLSSEVDTASTFSANSTMRHVVDVSFMRLTNQDAVAATQIASTVSEWFKWLRKSGVRRLDYVAFGSNQPEGREWFWAGHFGRVPVAIQTESAKGFELWYPEWQFRRSNGIVANSGREGGWHLLFRNRNVPSNHITRFADLTVVKKQFRRSLVRIADFAGPGWSAFGQGLESIDTDCTDIPYYHDMLPSEGYSDCARQLLAAAFKTWVFSGMGNWGDSCSDSKEYVETTAEFYQAWKTATVAAANSFVAPGTT